MRIFIIHACDDYALRFASELGRLKVVRLLIKNGANIHANNNHALKLALKNGHSTIAKYLIKNGAEILPI